jgi:hypothetical protein
MKALSALQQSTNIFEQPQLPFSKQAQGVLSAQTGKEQAPAPFQGPQKSNLGEKAAQDQTRQNLFQVEQQRGMASQFQQAEQARQAEQQQMEFENINEQELDARDELLQRGEEILQEWRNQGTQLDTRKQAAQYEQLGFVTRLADDQYISNLRKEGRKSRLQNKLKFKEALQKSIFDDERELFENDLTFRQALSKDSREFAEMLNSQGLDWKQALAVSEAKAEGNKQMWEGVSGVAQTGISTYAQANAADRAGRQKWVDAGSPGTYQSWSEANENALYAGEE